MQLNSSATNKEGVLDLKANYDMGWQRKVVVEYVTADQGMVF